MMGLLQRLLSLLWTYLGRKYTEVFRITEEKDLCHQEGEEEEEPADGDLVVEPPTVEYPPVRWVYVPPLFSGNPPHRVDAARLSEGSTSFATLGEYQASLPLTSPPIFRRTPSELMDELSTANLDPVAYED